MRRVAIGLVAALVASSALLGAPTAPADALDWMTPEERGLAQAVLNERVWNEVPNVMQLDGPLTGQAQLQASRMAACSCLFHSPDGEAYWWVGQGWTLGVRENVGAGPDVYAIHLAFVGSPAHLANMLAPDNDGFGIAIRRNRAGVIFIAEVFGGF